MHYVTMQLVSGDFKHRCDFISGGVQYPVHYLARIRMSDHVHITGFLARMRSELSLVTWVRRRGGMVSLRIKNKV